IIEVPPDNDIFFQTTGEQGDIGIGDYYSSQAGDNIHHLVGINIPCLPNQIYRIDLFDPEIYDAGAPGIGTETVDDEVRPLANPGTPVGDQTHFILRQPNGTTVLADVVFGPHDPAGPAPATHNSWVIFGTITLPSAPVKGDTCGSYTIEVWTGDEAGVAELNDDDNAWKHRILGNPDAAGNETFNAELGPDGRLGTGDEVWLDVELLSYQHNTTAAQSFYWFVDDGVTRTWIGRNFDIDIGTNLCNNVPCELTYIAPSGNVFPASLSGNQLWNPGQPDRGPGDLFTDAEAGLWRVDILMPVNNQYIIEIENNSKPIFLEQPILPDVVIAKDDGLTLVQSPGVTTYTIVATNTGKGPALSVLGPEVVDTLPVGMAFAGCAINPPLEGTCAESTPGSGTINFELNPQSLALNSDGSPFGPILAYLPGVSSGLTNTGRLQVSANIAPGLLDGTLLTNTVTIDWTDTYNNDYPTRSDDDIDFVQASAPTPTPSVTPTPTPTLTPTPTFISTSTPTDDDDDPTSTPQGSTPVAPTPLPGTPVAGLVLDAGATTPVLPVNFLPETGLRAAKQPQISAGQMSLMLALGGLSATMFCLWLRSKRKD
ncbi:MAG TPA: hypothetical protein VEC96_03930, partial [Anaerolineae bacterium]|nr:hypothetical protein [Anaerolineae bacterium]